jgi:G3E family GTPase
MSHSHATAFYWSHAGQHFEIRDEGDWWAAVPDDDWPADPAQRGVILGDFAPGVGDRRQEIVFIGAGMDEAAISAQLDGALLTEEEMEVYTKTFGEAAPDPAHEGM